MQRGVNGIRRRSNRCKEGGCKRCMIHTEAGRGVKKLQGATERKRQEGWQEWRGDRGGEKKNKTGMEEDQTGRAMEGASKNWKNCLDKTHL